MIELHRNSRCLAMLAAVAAVVALSGCRQMSTWTNASPSVSTPSADPFGYPPNSDTYYHKPESEPTLAPVPELPAPGHSVPTDPPPPPVPGEAENSSRDSDVNVTAKPKSIWNLRGLNPFHRKATRPESAPSVDEPAESTGTLGTPAKAAELPLSKADRTSKLNVAQPVKHEPTKREVRTESPAPQPLPLPDSYTGPIITPGAEYSVSRNVPIEAWPHAKAPVDDQTVRLRRPTARFNTEDFGPVEKVSQPETPASVVPTPETPPVPLLLPPGP